MKRPVNLFRRLGEQCDAVAELAQLVHWHQDIGKAFERQLRSFGTGERPDQGNGPRVTRRAEGVDGARPWVGRSDGQELRRGRDEGMQGGIVASGKLDLKTFQPEGTLA